MGAVGPVTQGFGGDIHLVIAAIEEERAIRLRTIGRSGKRRLDDIDEIIVCAKLIEVNGEVLAREIKGCITVKVQRHPIRMMVEHTATRVRKAWEGVIVSVKRLK